jgi:hypothetical protein
VSLREIVEAPNFKHDLDMYRHNYPEIDQIYDEAKLVLQENPAEGDSIEEGSGFRRYLTPATDDTPGFLIYYAYDIDYVYLHQIRKVEF